MTLIPIGAAVGKPVRFVTGATAGMEVRLLISFFSLVIVHIYGPSRNLTIWYVLTRVQRFNLTHDVV